MQVRLNGRTLACRLSTRDLREAMRSFCRSRNRLCACRFFSFALTAPDVPVARSWPLGGGLSLPLCSG